MHPRVLALIGCVLACTPLPSQPSGDAGPGGESGGGGGGGAGGIVGGGAGGTAGGSATGGGASAGGSGRGGGTGADGGRPDTAFGRWLANQTVGAWATFPGSAGFATSLFESTNMGQARDAMGYASVAAYDPVNGELVFTGKGYGAGTEYLSVAYAFASNAWSVRARGPAPSIFEDPGPEAFGHAYNGNAFEPRSGRVCFYAFQTPAVQCWNRVEQRFRTAWLVPGGPYSHATPVLLPFPEYGVDGGVLFQAKSNGAWLLDLASGQYRNLGSPWTDGLHSIGAHNPVKRELLFGGGSNQENGSTEYWIVDVRGTLSARRNWPLRAGVELNDAVLHDPTNGDWLLVDSSARQLYRSADGVSWTGWGSQTPGPGPIVHAVLPAYGCIVAITSGFAGQNTLGLHALRLR